ncbi:MAG: hypothetical protein MJ057_06950 [Sphaerochaetaceae bacterium]|nr:hypothetical protein [Sphaerochaetaceae bacterium]
MFEVKESERTRAEAEMALYAAVYEADKRAEKEGWKTMEEVRRSLKK